MSRGDSSSAASSTVRGEPPIRGIALGAIPVILALFGLAAYARHDLRTTIADAAQTNLEALVRSTEIGMRERIESYEARAGELASRPAVAEQVDALIHARNGEERARAREALRALLERETWYPSAVVVAADGEVLVGVGAYESAAAHYSADRIRVFRDAKPGSGRFHFPIEEPDGPSPIFVGARVPTATPAYFVADVDPVVFERVMRVARPGRTGEVYGFDDSGDMIGRSRFSAEIARDGLLSVRRDGGTYLALRDPGVDVTRGERPRLARDDQPLTSVVRWAKARPGVGAEVRDSHRDYRGVPVVSAWRWMPERGYGLVAEMDAAEAFAPTKALTRLLRGLVAILGLVGLAAVAALALARRAARRAAHFEAKTGELSRYEVVRKIGEGGMGTVYEVRHASLRKRAALKLLSKEKVNAELVSRFANEARLTSSLSHPNVVSVFDFGRTRTDDLFYVMEYIDGIDLDDLVRRIGPLPPGRAAHLLRQICAALAEAHDAGLVHRDVKPANALVCTRPGLADLVKVVDFGLVKSVEPEAAGLTVAHGYMGTPEFSAPEVFHGAEHADARSDLYSLGALGYWLVTGVYLFEGRGVAAQAIAHASETPALPSQRAGHEVDPQLEATIVACLAKRPEDRPRSARAVVAMLEGVRATWSSHDAETWWAAHAETLVAARDAERIARGDLALATSDTAVAPVSGNRAAS